MNLYCAPISFPVLPIVDSTPPVENPVSPIAKPDPPVAPLFPLSQSHIVSLASMVTYIVIGLLTSAMGDLVFLLGGVASFIFPSLHPISSFFLVTHQ